MILDKLLAFHEKTLARYAENERRSPWKEKVMRIHQESGFLFYYEEMTECSVGTGRLVLAGEIASGKAPEDRRLFFYDGKGRLLARGRLLSDPEEKSEEKRSARGRKNVFGVCIEACPDHEYETLSLPDKRRVINGLDLDLSLVTDTSFE